MDSIETTKTAQVAVFVVFRRSMRDNIGAFCQALDRNTKKW